VEYTLATCPIFRDHLTNGGFEPLLRVDLNHAERKNLLFTQQCKAAHILRLSKLPAANT